ncbi:rRNA maturation RNase YbeY [Yoonia sp. MH D7]
MIIDCMIEDKRWATANLEALAEAAAVATFRHLKLKGYEVSLLACNDKRIAELNADFRGKPTPTNVLSWPSDERGAAIDGGQPLPPTSHDPALGDIAIAYDTCAAEALSAGKSLPDHATHLIIHGILHLLGYDHERDHDATLMEGLETTILGSMGQADPYRA